MYRLAHLTGLHVAGPAIIIDNTNTMVIEPNCRASVIQEGSVVIELLAAEKPPIGHAFSSSFLYSQIDCYWIV